MSATSEPCPVCDKPIHRWALSTWDDAGNLLHFRCWQETK